MPPSPPTLPPHRRIAKKWWWIAAGIGVVAVLGVAGGLSTTKPSGNPGTAITTPRASAAAPPTIDTSKITAAPVTALPAPTVQGFPVGTPVPDTAGDIYTVDKTSVVQSGNQFEVPPPGGLFWGAHVKLQAGTAALMANPVQWAVHLADDSEVQGTFLSDPTPGPALGLTNIQPGQTLTGWIYFALPAGSAVTQIRATNTDWYWTN